MGGSSGDSEQGVIGSGGDFVVGQPSRLPLVHWPSRLVVLQPGRPKDFGRRDARPTTGSWPRDQTLHRCPPLLITPFGAAMGCILAVLPRVGQPPRLSLVLRAPAPTVRQAGAAVGRVTGEGAGPTTKPLVFSWVCSPELCFPSFSLVGVPSCVPRKNPKTHAVNNHLHVFGGDVAALVFPELRPGGGHGEEFDLGRVFPKRTERASGVEP